MTHSARFDLTKPAGKRESAGLSRRLPVVPVAVAMAGGIVADRYLALSPGVLANLAAAGGILWLGALTVGRSRFSTVLLLVLCGVAGALHHHQYWSSRAADDIGRHLSDRSVQIRVRGRIATRPVVYPIRKDRAPSAIPQTAHSRVELDCDSILTEAASTPVTGRVRLLIRGQLRNCNPGDTVEVQGFATGLPQPRNPNEFDRADSLRRRGIRGSIRLTHPALVRPVIRTSSLVARVRVQLRERCNEVLQTRVGEEVRPIASALLLGDRTGIGNGTRTMFIQSGTMHMLAISGLHTGILALFILACARLCRVPSRAAVVVVMVLMTIYLGVADMRPPVIRAYVLILVWGFGRLLRRPSFSANSLAFAAIVVLLLNPTDLFDVGAQLSFLAVASIVWLGSKRRLNRQRDDVAADRSLEQPVLIPTWRRSMGPVLEWLKSGYAVSGTIWLVSAPLVAAAFNVISPAGLLLNVLLIPFVSAALCLGFVSLALGLIHPALASPVAAVFEFVLGMLLRVVEMASTVNIGHIYIPAPPAWWLLGIYALVAIAMIWSVTRRRSQWVWCAALLWLVFGLSLAAEANTRSNQELTCTFLSVGHGCAIVVETPGGKTLVYDVGSITDGEFSARTVERALWAHGRTRVDALVLSHADIDHYNGAGSLLTRLPVGSVMFSRHFPDPDQAGTLELCELAVEHGIPLQTIARGDRLLLDSAVQISVLHPRAGNRFDNEDNALSVVLLIEYAGQRILLTGDVDGQGLDQLMRQPPIDVDILLAPHHGSPSVDLEGLADWCRPELIVVSSGNRFSLDRLRDENPGLKSPILSTYDDGAVEVSLHANGRLSHRTIVNSVRSD